MTLQLKAHFGGGTTGAHPVKEVQGHPGWYSEDFGEFSSKIQNVSNWWYDSDENDFIYSIVGNLGFIQYGTNRSDFASCRFTFEKVTWTNEQVDDENNITADVTIEVKFLGGQKTTMSQAGYPVINSLEFNGQTIASRTGNTIDSYSIQCNPQTFNVRVKVPPQQYAENMNLTYKSVYPQHQIVDATLQIGFSLYNPLPPTYIPMAIRKSGGWKSLNANHGFIKIRKSNTWVDKSKENLNTQRHENTGHNRIRKSSKWLQLPKM